MEPDQHSSPGENMHEGQYEEEAESMNGQALVRSEKVLEPEHSYYDDELSPASTVCGICQSLSHISRNGLYRNIKDVENASKECTTCKLILECIEPFRNTMTEHVYITPATTRGYPCTIGFPETSSGPWLYEVYISPHSTVEWSIFPSSPNCREVSTDSSSDDCMDLAKDWIFNCCASHTSCKYDPSTLPKRVIKVGTGHHDLLLHVSSGQVGRYAALSHCWGGEIPQKTTSKNIDSRKKAMSFLDLPKTFQDAIVVTRKLGLDYIWIDSLCIIQDSPEDWNSHVATMASIYRNAYVTIAAAGAESSEKGCFLAHDTREAKVPIGDGTCIHIRPYRWNQGCNLEIKHHGANYAPCHSWSFDCFSSPSTPLESRAWAFQERILSPRTLHFTKDELVFECRKMIRCECRMRPEVYAPGRAFKNLAINRLASAPTDGTENHARGLQEWSHIIQQYSSRSLTFPTDKLPALAGIVDQFETQFKLRGGYIAGLWKQHLPLALLWRRVVDPNSRVMTENGYYRYPEYIAPTWSWASLSGPINYGSVPATSHTLLATLDHVYVNPEEPVSNPHGAVNYGEIVLSGLLIKAVTDLEAKPGMIGSWTCRVVDEKDQVESDMMIRLNESIKSFIPDVANPVWFPVEVPVGDRVYLMPITAYQPQVGGWRYNEGLVLQWLEKEDSYKRVGRFTIICEPLLWEVFKSIAKDSRIRIV